MTVNPQPAGGVIDGAVHRYALRVYYEDTDAGGIVYHANYLRWFERTRSDLLEMLGVDQAASLAAGEGAYTVAEVTIRYLVPARLGDAVVIETCAETIGASASMMKQVAWRGDVKLTEAHVRVCFVGPDGRPRRQPEAWRKAFAEFAAGVSSPAEVSLAQTAWAQASSSGQSSSGQSSSGESSSANTASASASSAKTSSAETSSAKTSPEGQE